MKTGRIKLKQNGIYFLFMLITFVPFAILMLWNLNHIKDERTRIFNENLSRFTHNTTTKCINRQIDDIELVLTIISNRLSPTGLHNYIDSNKGMVGTILSSVVPSLPFFNAAILSDVEGNYAIYPSFELKNSHIQQIPLYPDINLHHRVYFSEPYNFVFSEKHHDIVKQTITVSKNLFDIEMNRYGNIAFNLDLQSMSKTLNSIIAPFEGRYIVVANNGTVIMTSSGKDDEVMSVPREWITKSIGKEGRFYDNKLHQYVFYKTLTNPSWKSFTVVDEARYDKWVNEIPYSLIYMVIISLTIYLVLIFVAHFYVRDLMRTLYMLSNGIDYNEKKKDFENLYENIKKRNRDLNDAYHISTEDPLMKIGNRRKFDEKLECMIKESNTFWLAIIDLDNFKTINDTYGHDVGDSVLHYMGKTGKSIMDENHASLYRFGGEELVVLFKGNDIETYLEALETWRLVVAQRQWREKNLQVTFSCGIAVFKPDDTGQSLLKRADLALYQAKSAGKNRIIRASI
ncbi:MULTISPECIES: sensor domain-containing diguanylate cyclase [unclassified Leclercia]|uniref:diguanylate cyclase n=1 Tax=Leclercia barmai TaxID=2785629 RepID=A0ABS7RZP9_9ENTR|nr:MULTISPECIES: sensor domain-containing diguanylate cyclase [unclassified Leclercia]MBZ0059527.1 GGDEF domain-containing protein [Leclercia sp. EMC7]MCM5697339.1 sensor domain-containing diguanylate cyclase [Leclercia sp. LTM01]MCM5702064.1 sensor domain-containing diguanylate cyclase [Leclercia sp. LTM14]